MSSTAYNCSSIFIPESSCGNMEKPLKPVHQHVTAFFSGYFLCYVHVVIYFPFVLCNHYKAVSDILPGQTLPQWAFVLFTSNESTHTTHSLCFPHKCLYLCCSPFVLIQKRSWDSESLSHLAATFLYSQSVLTSRSCFHWNPVCTGLISRASLQVRWDHFHWSCCCWSLRDVFHLCKCKIRILTVNS